MNETFPSIPGLEILKRLGAGGMGEVFLARHHGAYGFKKLVALKLIRADKQQLDNVRKMFMDEARLVALLDHPAIVQVHNFGEHEEQLYLVMEYVAGKSFSRLLSSHSRKLSPLISASLAARACRGLHAAHETKDVDGRRLNVVHRDMTPQNLVLTFDGRVKILDFGIALMRARSAPATGAGLVRGKASYLAPEQITGAPIDRRADVYSLSIVLYQLLTAHDLFTTMGDVESRAGRIAPPSELAGPLPKGLDAVVLKGLAFAPRDRFRDAKEMAEELEGIVEREGGESLEAFTERELAADREEHDEHIRLLLGGTAAPREETERPNTVVDRPADLLVRAESITPSAWTDSTALPAAAGPTLHIPIPAAKRGRRSAAWLTGIGAAVVIGVLVVAAVRVEPTPVPASASAPVSEVRPPVPDPDPDPVVAVEETTVETATVADDEEEKQRPRKKIVKKKKSQRAPTSKKAPVIEDGLYNSW
jgi:tRNA A-37 threonylcarbamoyl transferase component Bud32